MKDGKRVQDVEPRLEIMKNFVLNVTGYFTTNVVPDVKVTCQTTQRYVLNVGGIFTGR